MTQLMPPASAGDENDDAFGSAPTTPLPYRGQPVAADDTEPMGEPLAPQSAALSLAITPDRIVEELATENGEYAPDDLRYIGFTPRDGRIERIGLGSSSDVYAGSTRAGALVAVKVFRGDDHDELRKTVAKEWRASQRDFGPRIVHSRAAYLVRGRDGDLVWLLIMNLVSGPNLGTIMQQVADGDEVDHQTQVRWLRAGLEGLQVLSAAQHQLRDVKPDNIGLDDVDRALALPVFFDHGAAKREGTKTLLHAGTPAYAAPEWIRRTDNLDKVDIYSLGASLIDVYTGGEGFEPGVDDDERSLIGRPRLDHPRLSPEVARVLRGALVKDPDQRPGVDELIDVLSIPSLTTPPWDPFRPFDAQSTSGEDHADVASRGLDATEPMAVGDEREEEAAAAMSALFDSAAPTKTTPLPTAPTDLDGRPVPVRVPEERPISPIAGVQLLPLTEDIAALEQRSVQHPVRGRWLEKFAGVDPRYVVKRSNRTVYRIVGLMLGVYALYATAAITALVTMATGDFSAFMIGVGAIIGALVATVVVSLDRSIMAMTNANLDDLDDPALDDQPVRKSFSGVMVLRILFAVLFAVLVGEAANQVIFARDIAGHMAETSAASLSEVREEVDANYADDRANQQAKVDAANAAISAYQAGIDAEKASAAGEAAGTSGTMRAGCEDQCMLHLNQAAALIAGQAAFNDARNAEAVAARAELDRIAVRAEEDVEVARGKLDADNGLLSREAALWEMLTSDPWMLLRYVIVSLLLIFVELAAVLIKLATRGNNYERAVARALRQEERADRLRHGMLRNLARRRARDNEKAIADADRAFYNSRGRRTATWG